MSSWKQLSLPQLFQLGNEHSRLGKAKSQVGEKAGHSSISHWSDVRGICSRAAAEHSEASRLRVSRLSSTILAMKGN